jgi:hypothetical protein
MMQTYRLNQKQVQKNAGRKMGRKSAGNIFLSSSFCLIFVQLM